MQFYHTIINMKIYMTKISLNNVFIANEVFHIKLYESILSETIMHRIIIIIAQYNSHLIL